MTIFVGSSAHRGALADGGSVACQKAPRHRAEGNQAEPFRPAQRNHVPFILAIDEVVVILDAGERYAPVPLRDSEGPGQLPCWHRGDADMQDLACSDQRVESLDRLLQWRIIG